MPRPISIVILAAGLGTRFREGYGKPLHKALAPLWDEQGTLAVLLQHLKALQVPAENITVATGFMAESIIAASERIYQGLRYQFNPHYSTDTMLQTLARTFEAKPDSASCWVLFADTLYSRRALEQMLAAVEPADLGMMLQVAVKVLISNKARGHQSEKSEVTVSLSADNQFVSGFNSDSSPSHHMAHAVYWPTEYQSMLITPDLLKASSAPQPVSPASQWQVLQQWIEHKQIKVLALQFAAKASQDVDTTADLSKLQHLPLIKTKHLDYFSRNLCKDKRSQEQSDKHVGDFYYKYCGSDEAAQHEYLVMRYLQQENASLVPAVISHRGRVLKMELANGVRFYDLLRCIRGQTQSVQIQHILLQRCTERLLKTQSILRHHQTNISNMAYPFELQVSELLYLLTDVLSIAAPKELQSELEQLADKWQQYCCIPFRDATPKNIIIVEADVSPLIEPNRRQLNMTALTERPLSYWQEVPIQDVDFTSTYHLTTPEDDLISLLAHACTYASGSLATLTRLLDDSTASQERLDLTLLVRYLRFGGRKLAYKLLNPRGFEVRFRYDEPCFYFEHLLQMLSVEFKQNYPVLSLVLKDVRDTAERYRGVHFTSRVQDAYLLSMKAPFKYWQESPLELHARCAG